MLFDPGDCLGSAADVSIQPGRELLLLVISQPAVAADIVEADERIFATTRKRFAPVFERFGMNMQDGAYRLGILATVE